MPSINQLNTIDQISGGDLLPVYSQANGDARKLSLTNFVNWLNTQSVSTGDGKVTQYSAPTTGSTVLLTDNQSSIWLLLTPAGTLSTLTLKLPLQANCVDKQEILVNSTQAVTTLTIDGNGSTVTGAPSSLSANGFFTLRFEGVTKIWYRVG